MAEDDCRSILRGKMRRQSGGRVGQVWAVVVETAWFLV